VLRDRVIGAPRRLRSPGSSKLYSATSRYASKLASRSILSTSKLVSVPNGLTVFNYDLKNRHGLGPQGRGAGLRQRLYRPPYPVVAQGFSMVTGRWSYSYASTWWCID
jgi:hypothetical protein